MTRKKGYAISDTHIHTHQNKKVIKLYSQLNNSQGMLQTSLHTLMKCYHNCYYAKPSVRRLKNKSHYKGEHLFLFLIASEINIQNKLPNQELQDWKAEQQQNIEYFQPSEEISVIKPQRSERFFCSSQIILGYVRCCYNKYGKKSGEILKIPLVNHNFQYTIPCLALLQHHHLERIIQLLIFFPLQHYIFSADLISG